MSWGRMTMPKLARTILAGTLAASLAGCISLGAEPPESLLTLTPTTSALAGTGTQANSATAIAVIEPGAPQKLNVTRVPVQVTDTEIAYLQDAVWVEKPARLFQRLLAETIRTRSGRVVVDGEDPAVPTTTQLHGTLREFGFDAMTGEVVVRFDAVRGGEGDTIETRRFEASEPAVANPDSVGTALNRAANDVAGQVADWVAG